MRSLSKWPRPSPDYGIGLHVLTKADNQVYCDDTTEAREHPELWKQLGVTWLKLLTRGDSQLRAAEKFVRLGFEVVVRMYAERPHPYFVPPVDQMKMFADVGVHYIEGGNEADHTDEHWGYMTPLLLGDQYISFADASAHAGVLPCFYAFEGDRLPYWVLPIMRHIIGRGRKDALEGSAIAGHWRPGNYWRRQADGSEKEYPPDYAPLEPDGKPGFVFRSYEAWDDEIRKLLGGSLPFIGAEAGFEPSEVRGDLKLHARLNAQIATMDWRPCLFTQCFWTWLPDWSDSGWLGKPVVDAFINMPKKPRWSGNVPPPPPPPPPPSGDVGVHPGHALYDYAQAHGFGQPLTDEWEVGPIVEQVFANGRVWCAKGQWDKAQGVKHG